jgi:hypothetical protein
MKQRFVTGFLAAALTALTFAAQADTRSPAPYVALPSTLGPPPVTPTYVVPAPPSLVIDNRPTVPYSPPPVSSYERGMNNAITDYIWNGR